MGIFYFPCNFVYWRKIANHEMYKSRFLDIIENIKDVFSSHDLISEGYSTYQDNMGDGVAFANMMADENADIIRDLIWNTIDEMTNEINSRPNTPKVNINCSAITNMWFSKYEANSTVSMHEHYSNNVYTIDDIDYKSSLVAVYIIQDPNEKNTTKFVQPYMISNSLNGMRESVFDTSKENDIGEGTILIFPSTLHHEVLKIKKSGRIIVSFNIHSNIMSP